jgi:hypothetical protein
MTKSKKPPLADEDGFFFAAHQEGGVLAVPDNVRYDKGALS